MKQLFKLFGIIAVTAMIIFTMTACPDEGDKEPTNRELADEFALEHAAIIAKTVETVAISDEAAVDAALAAYDELSAEVKALLVTEKALLDNLKAKITELKAATSDDDDVTLTSIAITTNPTRLKYGVGQTLDLEGLVVTATYSDDSTKTVTNYTTNPQTTAALNDVSLSSVTVSYTENDITKDANFNISVAEDFLVDLSTLSIVKNTTPFTQSYEDFLIEFPEYDVDFTKYSRITIKAKYYDETNTELPQLNSRAMVTLIYNPEGDLRGPDNGPGPNTPLKEFNIGGSGGRVSKNHGAPLDLNKAPGAILFQNQLATIKYIEVTEIKFHNSNLPIVTIPVGEWATAERWSTWSTTTTATIEHFSVASDGVVTFTIGGTAEAETWNSSNIQILYAYETDANKKYRFTFEAWTESDSRSLEVQPWSYAEGQSQTYNIDTTRREYHLTTNAAPPIGYNNIGFFSANKTGTFYIKMGNITEVTD